MVEFEPIALAPPNCPIQTMTSYCGAVVLLDISGLESRNMSITTSADAAIEARVWLLSLGAMDQSTCRFREERFRSWTGSCVDSNLTLGKACTAPAFSFQFQLTSKLSSSPAICRGGLVFTAVGVFQMRRTFRQSAPDPSAPH